MIESNVVSKILKRNIIHNHNYFTNKKYNVVVKTYMNKIAEFQKKNYISFINVKNLNKHSTCNFKIIRGEIFNSLTNKVEKKFV